MTNVRLLGVVLKVSRCIVALTQFGTAYLRLMLVRKLSRHTSILIIPGDVKSLVGSRGDQALLTAVRDTILTKNCSARISILLERGKAIEEALGLGFCPLEFWDLSPRSWRFKQILNCFDASIMVGADVMDGHYSVGRTMKFWSILDQAARQGLKSLVMGCSYNANQNSKLSEHISRVSNEVVVNLRDPLSWRRFSSHYPNRGLLTADVAFLLKPSLREAISSDVTSWITARKLSGDTIIAFNINPHLILKIPGVSGSDLINISCSAIKHVALNQGVSFLLIPHDYRDDSDDEAYLYEIEQCLRNDLGERILLLKGQPQATEIKTIVSYVDAVVTGRMHLAIATLGQGVPVAAIVYQGKFEGLMEHFGLPGWLSISPHDALREGALINLIARVLLERVVLTEQIKQRLPAVVALSAINFEHLFKMWESSRNCQARGMFSETAVH